MSAALAIAGKLLSDDAVTNLIGDRIYPLLGSQKDRAFPQIVYTVTDEEPSHNYTGSSNLTKCFVIVSCIGRTYAESQGLAATVKASLDGQRGDFGSGSDAVTVNNCLLQSTSEDQIPNGQGPMNLLYTKDLTFLLLLPEA